MDLLIIENPGIHLFLETIKGCVILMYEQHKYIEVCRYLILWYLKVGWWKIAFYIVPDIKRNVRISVGTFVVAQ